MARSSLRGYNKSAGGDTDNDGSEKVAKHVKDVLAENFDETKVDGVDSARQFLSQNENKSEDELMGDLKTMIENGKQDGSFSKEMLDNFYNMAAPMMEGEQKGKLDNLINMIKNDQL